jgi:hypothetical protein
MRFSIPSRGTMHLRIEIVGAGVQVLDFFLLDAWDEVLVIVVVIGVTGLLGGSGLLGAFAGGRVVLVVGVGRLGWGGAFAGG